MKRTYKKIDLSVIVLQSNDVIRTSLEPLPFDPAEGEENEETENGGNG